MKNQLSVFSILVAMLFLGTFCATPKKTSDKVAEAATKTEVTATEKPTDPPFIAAIKEKIKGKENLPAEEVFENIQVLKGMPAGRVIPIMQRAFNQSLGVKCNHCHEFGKWASEVKPNKQIARDMWVMTGQINRELLANIKNLQSTQPAINCTTCHRGEAIPAQRM